LACPQDYRNLRVGRSAEILGAYVRGSDVNLKEATVLSNRTHTRRARLGRVPAATLAAGVTLLALPGLGQGVASAAPAATSATTPIQHVVVIYQENVSFDHYFGTYPNAANTDGPAFTAKPGTPAVNGLSPFLLGANPNSANPQRLANAGQLPNVPGELTCDQNHNYSDEQAAFNHGSMDRFVQTVGTSGGKNPTGQPCQASQVMDYYDGNSVTGLWNYAQNYAMSDNSFSTTFGPSSPGAINLISGNTGTVDATHEANNPSIATAASPNADLTPNGQGGFSLTSDPQPYWDDCSTRNAVAMNGQNIGDLLNSAGTSWGWFQGGERPTTSYAQALANQGISQPTSTFTPDQFSNKEPLPANARNQGLCNAVHPVGAAMGGTGQYGFKDDYIAHHSPFNYYPSTANPHHVTVPTDAGGNDTSAGLAAIGTDTQTYTAGKPNFDTPNHNYDTSDFDQLVSAIGHGQLPASALPAVSFIKAPGYQDGHAAYSNPIDEQNFITQKINALQQTPDWANTAVVINYDDSDGWYDHVYSGVHNPSTSVADQLTGPGMCGTGTPLAGQNGRCGYGPRQPMMVISPYAKANFVDHSISDQSSITKFVEDNWLGGQRITGSADAMAGPLNTMFDFSNPTTPAADDAGTAPRFLDPRTGQVATTPTPVLPESPWTIALGASALALGTGAYLITKRRRRPAQP